jgi:hypothetical protein
LADGFVGCAPFTQLTHISTSPAQPFDKLGRIVSEG